MAVVRRKNGSPLVVASKLSGTLVDDIIKANDPNLDFFQIEVDTTLSGGSASDQFACVNTLGTCDMGWGDGSYDTSVSSTITHTYASAGTYKVRCIGTQTWRVAISPDPDDRPKVTQINRFGFYNGTTFSISPFQNASLDGPLLSIDYPNPNLSHSTANFFRSTGLTSIPSTFQWTGMTQNFERFFENNPSFNSNVTIIEATITNLLSCFSDCSTFNNGGSSDINNWTTALTGVKECFQDASAFNQPVNNWNVSAVTDFQQVFNLAQAFNQNMEGWNVSNATTMNGIFREATNFNNGGVGGVGVGLDAWNFPLNQSLAYAFISSNFNQYVGSWNVSSVTDFTGCFRGTPFNNGLAAGVSGGGVGVGIDNWDVSNVGGFASIFESAPFNHYIGSWDISPYLVQSTNTSTATNKLIDTTQDFVASGVTTAHTVRNEATMEWANVVSVTPTEITFATDIFPSSGVSYSIFRRVSMYGMFYGNNYFNQDISDWRMDNVISTFRFFRSNGAGAFNNGGVGGTVGTGIDKWRFKQPCDFRSMFYGQTSFNQYMNSWDTSQVTHWAEMLYNCVAFNKPVNNWSFAGCTTDANQFMRQCRGFNQPVDGGTGWGETMSGITALFYAFNECDAWNQPMTVNWSGLTSNSTGVMSGCNVMNGGQAAGIRSRDVRIKFPAFASGATVDFSSGWSGSSAWNQDMESDGTYWDMSCWTGMSQAFFGTSMNQDLSSWELKSVTNMTNLFNNTASQLKMSLFNICKTLPGWVSNVPNTGCNAPNIFANKTISKTATESTVTTGTATSVSTLKLVDTGVDFVTLGVSVGDRVNNTTTGEYAEIKVVAATELDLDFDAFLATDNYEIITGYDAAAGYEAYNKLAAPTPASYTLSGTNTSTNTSELIDTGTDFVTSGVLTGMVVKNTTAGTSSVVSSVATNTLTLADDIFTTTPENYTIEGGYGWILTTGLNWT